MRRSLLAAAVLAVGIAACGSSSTPGPSASSSAAPSSAPTASGSIAPAQSAEASPAGTVYVVKKGDTLYAIAVRNGTTVKAILAVNPDITDPRLLRVGQQILVPAPTSSP